MSSPEEEEEEEVVMSSLWLGESGRESIEIVSEIGSGSAMESGSGTGVEGEVGFEGGVVMVAKEDVEEEEEEEEEGLDIMKGSESERERDMAGSEGMGLRCGWRKPWDFHR